MHRRWVCSVQDLAFVEEEKLMELKEGGTIVIKSSNGSGQMFIKEINGSIRVEVLGVMFLKEKESSDLTHVIDFWREHGWLPEME